MTIYSLFLYGTSLFYVRSNCCFLNCVQISQEAGQVAWYSHLFKNFSQFVVMYAVKGFGLINKAEVEIQNFFFWNSLDFFYNPVDVDNLMSGSSAFSKSSLNIWEFLVHVLLKPCFENFEHLLACEMSAIVR